MPGPVAAWLAGTTFGAAVIKAAVYLVVNIALTKISAALTGKPKMPSAYTQRRTVTRESTAGRMILYGEGITAGVLVYSNTGGEKNRYMDLVVAVAGHEITELNDVWFDDVKIPFADINSGTSAGGAVGGTGDYAANSDGPVAYIYKYLGTYDQTASAELVDEYSSWIDGLFDLKSEWTLDHRGRGVAYVHVRFRRSPAFEQGAPQNIRVGFKGAKIYDPRKDTTNGGAGSHRLDNPATWEYSRNPALIAADYLIGGTICNVSTYVPPRPFGQLVVGGRVNLRGFGARTQDVDWPSVIAAANICDEIVTVPDGTQVRYQADGGLTTDNTPADNIDQILTSMLGQIVYSAGKYHLYAGAYDTPVLTLDESDLAGPVEYTAGTPRRERYNSVKGVRWDSTTGEEVEFYPRQSDDYETADGARLYRDITLPFTTDEYRAQRIAQIILRRSREQQTIVWSGNLGCLRVGVWDTAQVSLAEFGISNKTYRCIARDVKMDGGEDGIVQLTLREEFPQTYTDPLIEDYGDLTPADPGQTSGDELDPPTALTITSTVGGIQFDITPAVWNPPGTVFEIYRHTASTPWASSELIWTGDATTTVLPFDDSVTYYFWVRARRGAAVSATFPETTGTSGSAGNNNSIWYRLTPDAEFTAGAFGAAGGWSPTNLATYHATGGLLGGFARLAPTGASAQNAYIRSYLPSKSTQTILGTWTIRVTVRYRVNSALTIVSSSPYGGLHINVLKYRFWNILTPVTTEDFAVVDLSAAVVGTWYTTTVDLAWTYDGEEGESPFVAGHVATPRIEIELPYTEVTAGELDIDYAIATVIA